MDVDYKKIFDEYTKPGFASGDLLDDIRSVFRRYVNMMAEQIIVMALWVVHAYLVGILQFTPYLCITSAERESGKSRVLDLLQHLVPRPWKTERTTAAALVRKVHAERPTLLLDETDAAFNGAEEYAETLRGILNSGFHYKGTYTMCVGQGAEMSYRDFSTYCAKAFAGINKLPDTIASRSIPIRLKRAPRGTVEKFEERLATVTAPLEQLRTRIESFADQIAEHVQYARPVMPVELSDRQADVTFPLLAIADVVGGEWPQLARKALVKLCTSTHVPQSIGEQLLRDIKKVFDDRATDRIASLQLAKALGEIEGSPWVEYGKGEKPITMKKVSGLLDRYDIESHSVRAGKEVFWGYERVDFEDAWSRYLARSPEEPPLPEGPPPPCLPGEAAQCITPLQANAGAANAGAGCNGVMHQRPIKGKRAKGDL